MLTALRLARRRPSVRLYLLSVVAFGLGTAIFDLVYNLHLLALGFSADDIGTLWAVGLAVMSLAAIPVGYLADRLGRRVFFVGGSLLFGATLLAFPLVRSLPALAAMQALNALGGIAMFTSESATMAGEVDPEERTTLFSAFYLVYLLADGAGSLLGGQLPRLLPVGWLSDYQTTLLVAGALGLAIGLIRLFLPLQRESVAGQPGQPAGWPSRPMLHLALVAFLIGGSATLAMRYINVVLQGRYGWDVGGIGAVLVLVNAAGLLGASATPRLAARFGAAPAAVGAMTLIFVSQVWAAFSPLAVVFLVPLLLRQALHYFQMPLLETFAVGLVPAGRRSAMSSYRQVGFYLGGAVSAKVYGGLLGSGAYAEAFVLSGILALLAGATYRAFYWRTRAPAESLAAAEPAAI